MTEKPPRGAARDPIQRIERADGSVRYRIRVDVGSKVNARGETVRDQRCFTFATKKEATRERARILHEVGRGTYTRPNRKLTLQELADDWLATKAQKKPATVQHYRDALRPVLAAYGGIPAQALDSTHLERVKASMLDGSARQIGTKGKPLSARSVNGTLVAISAVLAYGVRRQVLATNAATLVEKVPASAGADDRGTWQAADAVAFLRRARTERLYGAWMLTLSGLRRGEVLGLRWSDVDLEGDRISNGRRVGPTITVRQNRVLVKGTEHVGTPKARASTRTLPLQPFQVDALRELRRAQVSERLAAGPAWTDAGLVVVDVIGRPVGPETYSDAFLALSADAKLPRIPLHGARHAAASLMADLGVPIVVAAAWLGQSQTSVTAGYQHALWDSMVDASRRLGEALGGASV